MKFKVGDRVKLREAANNLAAPAGFKATVTALPSGHRKWMDVIWDVAGVQSNGGYHPDHFELIDPPPFFEDTTDYYLAITGDTDGQV